MPNIVVLVLSMLSTMIAQSSSSSLSASWQCQYSGPCAYEPLCPTCTDGPDGNVPGGCGYCKFISPMACGEKQCVDDSATITITTTGNVLEWYSTASPSTEGMPLSEAPCRAMHGNIQADSIVVLDVNSWQASQGAQQPPRVTTAQECCHECRLVAECNAWSFCYSPNGCGGSTCGSSTVAGRKANDCQTMGPYANNCTIDGQFPFLTCMLKRVNDSLASSSGPTNGDNGDADINWTSGVIATEDERRSTVSLSKCLPVKPTLCQ